MNRFFIQNNSWYTPQGLVSATCSQTFSSNLVSEQHMMYIFRLFPTLRPIKSQTPAKGFHNERSSCSSHVPQLSTPAATVRPDVVNTAAADSRWPALTMCVCGGGGVGRQRPGDWRLLLAVNRRVSPPPAARGCSGPQVTVPRYPD